MSVRRLHHDQPADFAFTRENLAWAKKQIAKFPKGRQASAVISLLWRAQEQHNGWLPEPAIRLVADMLDMPYIRVLEVATFYTMFQLQPVGKKAHIQVCGTTPCMLRGAEELKALCRRHIAQEPHQLSEDGDFSWEEVECLGACVNAPMVQIWKDTYEDLTQESFKKLLDAIAEGRAVTPGPQNGRHFSAPREGAITLRGEANSYGDPGDVPLAKVVEGAAKACQVVAGPSINGGDGRALKPGWKMSGKKSPGNQKPAGRVAKPGTAQQDDLKKIKGIGPRLEKRLNEIGIFSFSQIAGWGAKEIEAIETQIRSKGRIAREDWVKQAKALVRKSKG